MKHTRAVFTYTRAEVDHIIHNLKALIKVADNPNTKSQFVQTDLLMASQPRSFLQRLFRRPNPILKVVIKLDRIKKQG